jgi:predicted phosphodiesterase
MTQFVLVSDIHGNAPALRQVLAVEGRDSTYFVLGDIHGLNSYPVETLDLVREYGDYVLAGNHDKSILQHNEGHVVSDELSEFELRHTRDSLSDEDIEWMRSLPYMGVEQRGGNRIVYTHAMPWVSMASGYEEGNAGVSKGDVPSVAATVGSDYDYVFHGHTHTQYNLDASRWGHDVHFINPGSLGYDSTYSVVDTDTGEVQHKSVEVDANVQAHVQQQLPEGAPPAREWL